MKKERRFIYRFFIRDGILVYSYDLAARNAECAEGEMKKVIDRDFPEGTVVLGRVRMCSASRFCGTRDFPVFIDTVGEGARI